MAAGIAAQPASELALPAHKWLIAIAVMIGTTLQGIDGSVVNVSLPHMQGTFSASVDEIALVVTSYLVASSIMIPLTGWISGRFGRKRYFLTSVTVFVIASAFCGAATSLDQIIAFRLIQGAAGAAMLPSSQAILMETFPVEEQQLAMATWGVGLMVAPIMGPTLGGWITDNWSWRWNFYINIPIGAIAILMVQAFVYDPPYLKQRRANRGRIDYLGFVYLTLGLGLLQIVADRGQRADWFASHWVIYASLIAGACLFLLPFHELSFSDPILNLRILKKRPFAVATILIVSMSFGLFGMGLLGPVFLQELMGYSAWLAGWVSVPRGAGTMLGMLTVGQLARRRVDTRPLVGLGFILTAYSLWVMAHWNLQVDMWAVIWPGFLSGLGTGVIFPVLSSTALSCVEREQAGDAASLYSTLRNASSAIGISYMTTALTRNQQLHQSRLTEHLSAFTIWRMGHGGAQPSSGMMAPRTFGLLYGMVQAQSMMLSFNDIYRALAILMVLMTPTFLILPRIRAASSAASAAAD